MKRSAKFLIFIFLFPASCSLLADTFQVNRSGRRIQLDGFLMDWIAQERRPWGGSSGWVWDAVNTPEGVAGYFHSRREQCSSWVFFTDASRLKSKPWEMRVSGTAEMTNTFYRATSAAHDSAHALTVEWVIPWDSIAADSSGAYAIHVAGRSACGDSLQPLLLAGSLYAMVKHSWLPPRFAERIILIVVLLAVFIVMQFKVRKKTHRRGSLGRSA
jgi:hypothetical protein